MFQSVVLVQSFTKDVFKHCNLIQVKQVLLYNYIFTWCCFVKDICYNIVNKTLVNINQFLYLFISNVTVSYTLCGSSFINKKISTYFIVFFASAISYITTVITFYILVPITHSFFHMTWRSKSKEILIFLIFLDSLFNFIVFNSTTFQRSHVM